MRRLTGVSRRRNPTIGSPDAHDTVRQAIGQLHARLLGQTPIRSLRDAEFKVFSQSGDDGIIQHLVKGLGQRSGSFVEIGVEDYSESNTRFLLVNNDWKGLVIDAGTDHVRFVTESGLRWMHHIDTLSAFVTKDNINDLLSSAGVDPDVDLLSVDIDGNDYWILDSLTVAAPKIIVAEYNSVFGSAKRVTIPYEERFHRSRAHHSYQYYGASLAAITYLLSDRGYRLVGTNSAGNNAFFVRADIPVPLPELAPEEAFTPSRFRDARDENGELSYRPPDEEMLFSLAELPVVDLDAGERRTIRDVYGFE